MTDSKTSELDPYGFERGASYDPEEYEEFFSSYLSVLARRASRWSSVVTDQSGIQKSRKLKRFCRKGIPSEYRIPTWLAVSGAAYEMEKSPDLYRQYLQRPHPKELVEPIEMDIPRTFPDNIYFRNIKSDPSAKRKPLYNTLMVLGLKNTSIGYCQGLNYVAGMLLLIVKDEEKSFWLLDSLVNNILPDYYSDAMLGIKADQEVLTDLVKQKLPILHEHFQVHDVSLGLMTTKWFMCCFADVLPVETLLRVWDCLFYEGNKILFRVALTLLKENQENLLACKNFTQIIDVFKDITTNKATLDCHQFMKKIFEDPGSLPKSKIAKLRQENVKKMA